MYSYLLHVSWNQIILDRVPAKPHVKFIRKRGLTCASFPFSMKLSGMFKKPKTVNSMQSILRCTSQLSYICKIDGPYGCGLWSCMDM